MQTITQIFITLSVLKKEYIQHYMTSNKSSFKEPSKTE